MATKEISSLDNKILESQTPKEPNLYKVVIRNDDQTTQEFVVGILIKIFMNNPQEAAEIMWKIHSEGVGIAGVFPYDIATSRVKKAKGLARSVNFPLHLQCEPM